ncbi:MAG: DUF493 domain-containing protein [Gammaproteobacteria bacterium]|nr:DUF493 domain-containing protein [Gammaproteobacteria bacterium]
MSASDEELGLQFPCDFPIKVIGKSERALQDSVEKILNIHVDTEHQTSIKERHSKGARFISITVTIQAQSRKQLDELYIAFNKHDDIMMVL